MRADDASTLWTEMAAPLRAFVGRRVPREIDPDDIVQDVFVRIVEHLPELRDRQRVDAWIFQITRNAIVDTLRARHRAGARFAEAPEDLEAEAPADDASAATEIAACLAPMAARLAEPYRSAIMLTELEGVTQVEAARRAGISVSGMKSRVQRGREQLKAMLVACCEIALDRRGGVVECELRSGACSPCGDAPAQRLRD